MDKDKDKDKNKKLTEQMIKIVNDKKNTNVIEDLLCLEKDNPSNIAILQMISQQYLLREKNTEALHYINKAYEIDPDNYGVNYNLGRLYQKFKKTDKAIIFYKNSISLNSKFKEGFNSLGNLYFQKENYQLSIDCFKKSFDLDKTKENITTIAKLAEGLRNISLQNNNNEDLKESKFYYELINKMMPNNNMIISNIINISRILGLKNEATLFEKKTFGVFVFDVDKNKIALKY